ncbi:hypothetical protein GUA87_03755 [Sneathiella sp. P13V-1]|uniref:hypothetical protein n=1 Tax=Sneathiella sp. P13V-1 TaxID=2697366 RepID=UPI00187B5EB0|nr:hypothetical protein [Sneathiella sp. P13V-1]MBE7635945.1 hypothetical protein [Sneathiella sp. P13V-1]
MQSEEITENGLLSPHKIAEALGTPLEELAWALGFSEEDLKRSSFVLTDKAQNRLSNFIDILAIATPRFGSALLAYAWYRSEPLSGYADLTAMHLVWEGNAKQVLEYLEAIDSGVFA